MGLCCSVLPFRLDKVIATLGKSLPAGVDAIKSTGSNEVIDIPCIAMFQ